MNEVNELDVRTPRLTRRPLVIVGLVAVLAVAALGVAYVAFFSEDAPERLALSSGPVTTTVPTTVAGATATTLAGATPAPTTGAVAGLVGTWKAATGSTAGYRVREKLARLPAQSDAVARSSAVTGTVKVESVGGALTATAASFEVDLTKLASDPPESQRDNRIRTQGLQTNQFPTATFSSTKPIALPAGTATGQAVKASAEGDLTMHGVTKRVTIPLDVRVSGDKGELVGSLQFPMSDFNIDPPNIGGFVTVDSDATLEFKLVLEKA